MTVRLKSDCLPEKNELLINTKKDFVSAKGPLHNYKIL